LGNKGGIGVSLKVYGTTLLFLNAHLAGALVSLHVLTVTYCLALAHEGKAQLRVANLNKIKVESHTLINDS
jgi:hypothetical protein